MDYLPAVDETVENSYSYMYTGIELYRCLFKICSVTLSPQANASLEPEPARPDNNRSGP
jgi:hypothetical protein